MRRCTHFVLNLLVLGLVSPPATTAQVTTQKPTPEESDNVVRVKTELIQTDVTVVDNRGRLVSGLAANDFELRVDSRSQTLSFFEEVVAGSADEEKQLTNARKGAAAPPAKSATVPSKNDDAVRGRTIFFFVDDIHLTGESLTRARSVISHFIENKMTLKDRVAVVSTSGQIGFLQQLTDNKAVLREAISRLNSKYNPETTASQVSISEVDANLVSNHADRGLFAYLMDATMKEFQIGPMNAYTIVTNRVRQIEAQSKIAENDTLSSLQSLMHSTAPLTGRKLLFLISDGFVVDPKRSKGSDLMRSVANEAARVGVVIYSLDTRSNSPAPEIDASAGGHPDFSGRTASRPLAESKMPQEPLETLADETGGRSYLNSNNLDQGVAEALNESSAYYLLVWRPNSEEQKLGKSRLKVTIKGRPDLRVRMRKHLFEFSKLANAGTPKSESISPPPKDPENELKTALASLYPLRDVPTSVSASFANTAQGPVLNIAMLLDGETIWFDQSDAKQPAVVDVIGVAVDDRGRFSSFKQRLDIPREAVLAKDGRFIKWNQALPLPAGLYQVRVAVRDRQTGRMGSAMTWIEIPLR